MKTCWWYIILALVSTLVVEWIEIDCVYMVYFALSVSTLVVEWIEIGYSKRSVI